MSETLDIKPEPKAEKMSELGENFKKGIFLISMLILLVATFQLYFSIERTIEIWFEYQYIPIFRAVYNFIVLIASLYIIRLYIVRR